MFDFLEKTDESLVDKAKKLIWNTIDAGHPMVLGMSFGKDSSTVLNLVLSVVRGRLENGLPVSSVTVTHADTLIENPEVTSHVRLEMDRLHDYSTCHGLPLRIETTQPALRDHLLVKVIGGRCIPTFPNKGTRECAIDLKTKPQNRLKKRIFKQLEKGDKPPVTVIGTRFDESTGRKGRMEKRGETGEEIWVSPTGELMLSPIADWTDLDVWAYLAACKRGDEPSYSSLDNLFRLYRDGSDQPGPVYECRFGCCLCTVGRDKSLEAMLAKGERYRYMAGLNALQRFLIATQYDLDRRQWVGRSINEQGYIAIRPDVYSPAMMEELLRYCLTLDVQEKEEAYRLRIEPRFELISAQALIAIDAMWSMQGIHPAHHALKLFRDIYRDGQRFQIPEAPQGLPAVIPEARYLYVGVAWNEEGSSYAFSGLRDAILEAVSEEGDGCMGTRQLKNGKTVLDVNTEPSFSIDEEAAHFILGFELDYLLGNYGDENRTRNSAFRYYATTGCVQLAKGSQTAQIDMIMRRTAFKERNGLTVGPNFDLQALLAKTVSKKEMMAASGQKETQPHLHQKEKRQNNQLSFAWV